LNTPCSTAVARTACHALDAPVAVVAQFVHSSTRCEDREEIERQSIDTCDRVGG
jgi:hypothetical protein